MLSTYGIMLVKFNLITFLFQPLCIFNTHFTLHFKHFDYILLVRLAWFCRSHRGREKTRRYVELFFVFLDNWPEGSISFMNRDGWGTSLKSFVISPTTWVQECLCPCTGYPMRCWERVCALPAFRVVHSLPLGVGTRPPGEPCERQEPSTMVWWKLK